MKLYILILTIILNSTLLRGQEYSGKLVSRDQGTDSKAKMKGQYLYVYKDNIKADSIFFDHFLVKDVIYGMKDSLLVIMERRYPYMYKKYTEFFFSKYLIKNGKLTLVSFFEVASSPKEYPEMDSADLKFEGSFFYAGISLIKISMPIDRLNKKVIKQFLLLYRDSII